MGSYPKAMKAQGQSLSPNGSGLLQQRPHLCETLWVFPVSPRVSRGACSFLQNSAPEIRERREELYFQYIL